MGWSSELVVAREVIITGDNDFLLMYDADGNLIFSIAPMDGTAPDGSTYRGPGAAAYGGPGKPYVIMSPDFEGVPSFTLPSNRPGEASLGSYAIFMEIINEDDPAEAYIGWLQGPISATRQDVVGISLFSSALDGSFAAQGQLIYLDENDNLSNLLVWGSGGLFMSSIGGLGQQVSGTQLATVGPVVVTGTVQTTLASGTIPANDAESGSIYKLELMGFAKVGATTSETLEWQLAFGGTIITGNVAGAAFVAGANLAWRITATMVCVTSGAAGTWYADITGTVSQRSNPQLPGTAADNTVPFTNNNGGAFTQATTAAITPEVNFAWGGSGGTGQSLTCSWCSFGRAA